MATKYVRGPDEDETPASRRTPFERAGLTGWRSPRKRLSVIYIVLLVASLMIFATSFVGKQMPFRGQPVLRGVGTVVGKAVRPGPEGAEVHVLRIRIALDGGRWAEDEAEIGAEYWQDFSEGDSVGILYQVSRDGADVRIRECGLVALQDPMR